jgi:hypothetical protein
MLRNSQETVLEELEDDEDEAANSISIQELIVLRL